MSTLATAKPRERTAKPAGRIANPLERIAMDPHWLRQFSVAEYHQMVRTGILTPVDRVELLEGWIVNKMPQNSPHRNSITRTVRRVGRVLPDDWTMHVQGPITLSDSEPEPVITLARGEEEIYDTRHPESKDIGVLIEVGDSSVLDDRRYKGELYAKEKIAEFWLIDLVARKIEVYTKPRAGKYYKKVEYTEKGSVPLVLDGLMIAEIPVRELMAKS
jgi:Putative restriction endonuclease